MGANKTYLGDGAYADFDESVIILTTENGISATNTVYLEPEAIGKLLEYLQAVGLITGCPVCRSER